MFQFSLKLFSGLPIALRLKVQFSIILYKGHFKNIYLYLCLNLAVPGLS